MAAKIKDGLFVGDADSANDPEFLELNKISNLINFSGREVPNTWAAHGLVYITYNWEDRPECNLFGLTPKTPSSSHKKSHQSPFTVVDDITEFIDVSLSHGISVLLFCKQGTGRCCAATCAYLMNKYCWGFEKAYDLVASKKMDMYLNKGFMQQLSALDSLLAARRQQRLLAKGVDLNDPSLAIAESKRRTAWDTSYVHSTIEDSNVDMHGYSLHAGYKDEKESVRRRGWIATATTTNDSSDEELLINSYINSKLTITSLPGPFINESNIQKSSKLRFNNILQEEDVNMFPTSLPSPHQRPIRSILKKERNETTSALLLNGKGVLWDKETHAGINSSLTNQLIEKEQGKAMIEAQAKQRYHKSHYDKSIEYSDGSLLETLDGGGSVMSELSLNDPLSPLSSPMQSAHKLSYQNKEAQSSSKSHKENYERTNDGRESKQHRSDLLYNFVGIGKTSTRAEATSSSTKLTAEERIRSLVADLASQSIAHKNAPSSSSSSSSPSINNTRQQQYLQQQGQSSSKLHKPADPGSSSMTSLGSTHMSGAPSLYDLATMHLPSDQRSLDGRGNHHVDLAATDTLAAFEIMQQEGGAVRGRHNIEGLRRSTSNHSHTSSGNGVKAAWMPQSSQQSHRIYRQGSPQRSRTDGNNTGIAYSNSRNSARSVSSVSSLGSLDSAGLNGQSLPTRSGKSKTSISSSTHNQTLSSQRRRSLDQQSSQSSIKSIESSGGGRQYTSPMRGTASNTGVGGGGGDAASARPSSPFVGRGVRPASPSFSGGGSSSTGRTGTPTRKWRF